ncbi:hypothetical protein T484DRAFT_1808022 [Baffinella frigidus]|nr:hypothetical protein T484DRAFT_1808022 [Cryptophyta sp. CCMP2293]
MQYWQDLDPTTRLPVGPCIRLQAPGDIRKAYMALALQHHPDKGWKGADEGGGDDKFNAVQEAYEVLSSEDPVRRCAHDNYLRVPEWCIFNFFDPGHGKSCRKL